MMFGVALLLFLLTLIAVSWWSHRPCENVEDFVLAGRSLSLDLSTITIVATWYGAESLLTVANEVGGHGIRRALVDPFGIALCLILAGLFYAPRLYRMQLVTLSDVFRIRYGGWAEFIASAILIPSYFGWIAAQLLALANLLQAFLGIPYVVGVCLVAIVAAGFCIHGGTWSVAWIDTLFLGIMILGLVVLMTVILRVLYLDYQSSGLDSVQAWWTHKRSLVPDGHWQLDDRSAFAGVLAAISSLAIGSLGNLPTQDLMQRILSARSERTSQAACLWGSLIYLLLGLFPIGFGFAYMLLGFPDPSESMRQVVFDLSATLLWEPFQVLFFLAVVSTILSTLVNAVMAPAALLGINIVEPISTWRSKSPWSEPSRVALQRVCILLMLIGGVLFACSGETAYELVRDSYALILVGLFFPFTAAILSHRFSHASALASMLVGSLAWLLHAWADLEFFGGDTIAAYIAIPQEIGSTLCSGLALLIVDRLFPDRSPTIETQGN